MTRKQIGDELVILNEELKKNWERNKEIIKRISFLIDESRKAKNVN